MNKLKPAGAVLLGASLLPLYAFASSHREAPEIAGMPRLDGTDFYMFRSYEPGRSGYVTLIANYIPLQDPEGGPNFFDLDPKAVYQIHIDNEGDATSNITFTFHFTTTDKKLAVDAGGKEIAVPLINIGPISDTGTNLNVSQSYTLEVSKSSWGTGSVRERDERWDSLLEAGRQHRQQVDPRLRGLREDLHLRHRHSRAAAPQGEYSWVSAKRGSSRISAKSSIL